MPWPEPAKKRCATLKRYAALVPREINVNMFGLRFITDLLAFSRNGQPAQRTTGVLNPNWIKREARSPTRPMICFNPGTISPIASINTGSVRSAPIQNRRVRSSSSLFSSVPALGATGSSAIPQIGQAPALSEITSGCIGQVYFPAGAPIRFFSGSIPLCGQDPGSAFADCDSAFIENTFLFEEAREHMV